MKAKMIVMLTASAIVGLTACHKDDDDSMNQADRDFMKTASYSNNNEVDAGQMATSMGSDAMVKTFGGMMVSDHTTAEDELKTLSSKKGVTIPTEPDAAHISMKAMMMTMSGRAFDSAYMHAQVTDHQATIDLMQAEINNGKDQDVKSYATKYLPKVQMHKHMADSIVAVMHF